MLILKTYVLLLVVFTVAMVSVFAIPSAAVRDNVVRSAAAIDREGVFRKVLGVPLWQIDNMTDCMMMNIAVFADSSRPVESAMLDCYGHKEWNTPQGYMQMGSDTEAIARGGRGEADCVVMYGRYWHGYQVVLRPLLVLFDYVQIRIINYIFLFLLAAAVALMLWRRAGGAVAALFGMSLLAVGFPVVPLAMQFSTCFYVAFAGALVVMRWPGMARDAARSAVIFFTIGGVTAFLDFLTTPQITLGLPLVCALLCGAGGRRRCSYVVRAGLWWLLGYALLWSSKWGMAFILTDSGGEVLESAIESFVLRTSDSVYYGGEKMPIAVLLGSKLSGAGMVVGCAVAAVVAVTAFFLYRWRHNMDRYGWLLLTSAMVPVWYVLLRNHSLQHAFFTYRALFVTVFSVLLFVYYNVSETKKRVRNE